MQFPPQATIGEIFDCQEFGCNEWVVVCFLVGRVQDTESRNYLTAKTYTSCPKVQERVAEKPSAAVCFLHALHPILILFPRIHNELLQK